MTLLDDIIDSATDSTVATPDLLRKVQVVAHRVGAQDVLQWVRSELSGYDGDEPLPDYRVLATPVLGTFAGPMRSFTNHPLTVMPKDMKEWWIVEMRQPLLEILAFGEGPEATDPGREWPADVVVRYEASGAFGFEFETLFKAHNVITRQSLRGVVDVIKTKALDFALELQAAFPDAGEKDGPTVATDTDLATTIYNVTNHIYGDGANLATGPKVRQTSEVRKGDTASLREELRRLGISDAQVDVLVAALDEEQAIDHPKVKRFFEKLRDGSIKVGAGVARGVAEATVTALARAYLGV